MRITVNIEHLDVGAEPTACTTARVGEARAFLRKHDLEGSAVSVVIVTEDEEAYEVLRALATLKEKR